MANYVRKLVSGDKARFIDEELDLDLDLVYVTDQLIIMGFPADGLEGLYRNRREDAKKFLDYRHRNNYWVFNFCPLTENSYDAAVFGGRVSRYPFPDHHAPPLAVLALASREIRLWLSGSSERVAVLHCKAGKGRSGTVACAYLLSLDITPEPPRLQRSYTTKEWAKLRAEELMDIVETDDMPKDERPPDPAANDSNDTPRAPTRSESSVKREAVTPPIADVAPPSIPVSGSDALVSREVPNGSALEKVLALHTARRMKQRQSSSSSTSNEQPKKVKHGVSIPSQRRFLLYWSLILSRNAPTHFWPSALQLAPSRPKVKLRQITVRLRDPGGTKMTIVKTINKVLDKTLTTAGRSYKYGQTMGQMWVSLARYDDDFVELLENWERSTRNGQGNMKKQDEDHVDNQEEHSVPDLFNSDKWDKGKMVRSFARLGRIEKKISLQDSAEGSRIYTHVLTPLNQSRWTMVQKSIKENPTPAASDIPPSMKSENDDESFDDTMEVTIPDEGITLDADREVRAKLYLGQVFMGWIWFIPAFHMQQPPPQTTDNAPPPVHWRLSRKDVDFPIGIGAWIVDIDIEMAWVPMQSEASLESPPQRQTSGDPREGKGGEPVGGGILAEMGEIPAGESVKMAVETVQAARD